MTWFKVDDNLHSHPKRYQAGLRAMGLWTMAGSWSSAQLTNGFVPHFMLSALGGQPKDARALVKSGLWSENESGWQFHEWEQANPTRSEVEEGREDARNRQRQARERRRQAEQPRDTSQHVTRDTPVTHDDVHVPVSQCPDPTRPDPTRPIEEIGAADADAPTKTTKHDRRGTRLTDDWNPSRTPGNETAEQGHNREWLTDQLERFRNYWIAKPGQAGIKLDWDRTWQNWLKNAKDWASPVQANPAASNKPRPIDWHPNLEIRLAIQDLKAEKDTRSGRPLNHDRIAQLETQIEQAGGARERPADR